MQWFGELMAEVRDLCNQAFYFDSEERDTSSLTKQFLTNILTIIDGAFSISKARMDNCQFLFSFWLAFVIKSCQPTLLTQIPF